MSETSVADDELRSYVERIERLNQQKDDINKDISEVFKEAVGRGFDRKALKEVVRIRAADAHELSAHEAVVDLYLTSLGGPHVRTREEA